MGEKTIKHNKFRIFKRILPNWDHDLHVHSNWSQDNLDGPSLEEFIPLAERFKIHIGFADHFEFKFPNPKDPKCKECRLNQNSVDNYLEEIDKIKENYPFITSGLDFKFIPIRKDKLQEFTDDYRKQFDFFIGKVLEIEEIPSIHKKSSLNDVLDKFFQLEVELLKSKIFDCIAHPDKTFRFFAKKELKNHPEYAFDERILELGALCENTRTMMEVNLSGYRFPWKTPFPNLDYLHHLLAQGVSFIVGSNSYTLEDFSNNVLNIRRINQIIKGEFLFTKKF
ncbi:PHP domain-containing protein [Promethearchaeum syntrophicum]|uniref:PHP domain-containing protein n=1 Tax=Promethearchaeum syntrophicum TaxID=2594042 RepID=A0A5B9DA71_9ARCH|nr:PHP domain-containing protein [Candidatus Prometheoarchaeum syntrophicum]QEE15650.1 histidinol-phosphatase [Candidatus Prometheoarchaeum syntrophicum]